VNMDRLPRPDSSGTYWLNKVSEAPAILEARVVHHGTGDQVKFFVTTVEGPLCSGKNLTLYDDPEIAFRALKRWMKEGKGK
jgi:hypothetical protein